VQDERSRFDQTTSHLRNISLKNTIKQLFVGELAANSSRFSTNISDYRPQRPADAWSTSIELRVHWRHVFVIDVRNVFYVFILVRFLRFLTFILFSKRFFYFKKRWQSSERQAGLQEALSK